MPLVYKTQLAKFKTIFAQKLAIVATFRSMWLDWGVLNKGRVGRGGVF